MELKRGCLLRFGGVAHKVGSKRVARAMVRTGRPEWTARPRPGGFSVVTLLDESMRAPFVSRQVAERDGPPGLSLERAAWDLASSYLERLEFECRYATKAGS